MPKGLAKAAVKFEASSASETAREKAAVANLGTPLTVISDGSDRIVVDNGAIDYSVGNNDLSYYNFVDGNGNGNGLVDILYFQFNEPLAEGKYYGLINGQEAAFFVFGSSAAYVIADDNVASEASAATWSGSFDVGGATYTFSYDYPPAQTVSYGLIV